MQRIINAFSVLVSSKSKELNDALAEKISELKTQLGLWKAKESEIQGKIDDKKQELIQQGIPFDLGKINQISKDIIDYEKKVAKLQDDQKRLIELFKERQELIQKRQENKKEIIGGVAREISLDKNIQLEIESNLMSYLNIDEEKRYDTKKTIHLLLKEIKNIVEYKNISIFLYAYIAIVCSRYWIYVLGYRKFISLRSIKGNRFAITDS